MRKSRTVLGGTVAALLLLCSACSSGSAVLEKVDADRAVEIIEAGGHTVVDVRTPAEFAAGHVEGAVNVDFTAATFKHQVKQLDRDQAYILYCQSGNRSAVAAEKMAALGFDVVDGGGVSALESAGALIVVGD